MSVLRFRGQAWKLGNEIDTDQIVPGAYLNAPIQEQAQHVFESLAPDFAKRFQPGGILVAGTNFGCGSSRESAPEVLKHLGVAAIVADSFARIFFRNAIAIGLPVLVCRGASAAVGEDHEVEVDLKRATLVNLTTGKAFHGVPLNDMMKESLRKGGILKLLANK